MIFVEGLILGLFLGSIGSALVVCFFIGAGASRR